MLPSVVPAASRDGHTDLLSFDGVALSPSAVFECGYYEVEQVQYIADAFLQTLAAACVEKTVGDPFNTPVSFVMDLKKELLDYLDYHSKAYVAGTSTFYIEEPPLSPSELVDVFLDEFVSSKKNLFSKVSSIIMNSERKEDKIEELISRLERKGAWLAGQRESLAKAIIKTVDTYKISHCEEVFSSIEDLSQHKLKCSFRPLNCGNEGCSEVFSALKVKAHDAVCSWKLIPCEQGCSSNVLRSEMDKHCLTVCSMKLVTCPFFQAGCEESVPEPALEEHSQQSLGQHLLLVLRLLQEQSTLINNQAQRITVLEKVKFVRFVSSFKT
ncbi:hypothetical protein O6H91_05G131300 [Diphasiastrum complanatum]|uniref:Uncharacterized protein n=1 Tax=Diphasiastrum complanatum TaxID=34168 RepID=A0ACC2DTG1_DIPCM|nr:hypothetical protein O6H91_05G131300 [Diphasiastrum complanatum]